MGSISSFGVTSILLVGAMVPLVRSQETRTYIDDLGVVHSTTIDKPTIVTYANIAVSLFDYGLGTDQLVGTYGQYFTTGSDFDFSQPAEESSFTADPDPDDLVKLQSVTNLSPDCVEDYNYCQQFNITTLLELNPDYLVIYGYAETPWNFANFSEVLAVWPEERIIYNDHSLKGDDCYMYDTCYGKSMIDVIEQYVELSAFLNYELPSQFEDDLKDLCEAAQTFQTNMQIAHSNGVRALAGAPEPTTSFFANPVDDMVLRMFEELGMPILHPGSCVSDVGCSIGYFWETVASSQYFFECTDDEKESFNFTSCNENTLYPVDVWLYDHRFGSVVQSDDFAVAFPDLAIISGQMGVWPIAANKITPAHSIEILNSVGPLFASATRLHSATDCVVANVTSIDHRQSGAGVKGVGAGQYACYDEAVHNSKYFQWCESVVPSPVTSPPSTAPEASTPVALPTPAPVSSPIATPSASPTLAPETPPTTTDGSSAPPEYVNIPSFMLFLASLILML